MDIRSDISPPLNKKIKIEPLEYNEFQKTMIKTEQLIKTENIKTEEPPIKTETNIKTEQLIKEENIKIEPDNVKLEQTASKAVYGPIKPFTQRSPLDVKLTKFEDLVKFSGIPYSHLLEKLPKFDGWVRALKAGIPEQLVGMTNDNLVKTRVVFNSLNAEQQQVFLDIYQQLSNPEGSLLCIDAPPGTGKTFLLSCILTTCKLHSTYIVYTNNLRDVMGALFFNGISTNCCKFLMSSFNINFYKAINYWNSKNLTVEEKCKEVEDTVKSMTFGSSLYILDEDSVVSPMFIYFMFCLQKYHHKHIIFVGDKFQQVSINASKHHNRVNFDFINLICKTYTLKTKVRQQEDPQFVERIEKFVSLFKESGPNNIDFTIKYTIYQLFRAKFYTKEAFDTMYFAQFHTLIKSRHDRYEASLIKAGTPYTKAYMYGKDRKPRDALTLRKFSNCLLLVENALYIYTPNPTASFMVRLLSVGKNKLEVENLDLGNIKQTIYRTPLCASFIPDQMILMLRDLGYKTLYQFPLKELSSTYHAAQGLTIANTKIELNLDCSSLNSFYVGITRIKRLDQLIKIHTADLLNLAYTEKMNDGYYYKINDFTSNLDSLRFAECRNPKVFDSCTSRNAKIAINAYNQKVKSVEPQYTPLMNYVYNLYNNNKEIESC
ncbi:helicase-2a [Penaeus vannamei nudivirus]|nr:helicase [Penaeus vannamei nucleopolyhedrovirus]